MIDMLAELRAQMRARNAHLRMEIAFGNMAKSIVRTIERATDGSPFPAEFSAMEFVIQEQAVRRRRRAAERIACRLVRTLPVYPWWSAHRGFGDASLAQILAIAGDLNQFPSHSKLWKFFGLHVVDGQAAHRARGAAAAKHEFTPRRRAIMHNIGETVLKGNHGHWRGLYDARKAMEISRLPDVHDRLLWAHRRALRYMEKAILRALWDAWRQPACSSTLQHASMSGHGGTEAAS